jgi:transketolase C-terminal domain/subunit
VEVDEVPTVAEASVATAVGSVVTVVAEEVDSVVTVVAEEVDSVVTAVAEVGFAETVVEVGFAETVVEVGSVVGVADLKLPKSSGKSCLHHQWHVG